MPTGLTLFDRIWNRHVVTLGPGGRTLLYIATWRSRRGGARSATSGSGGGDGAMTRRAAAPPLTFAGLGASGTSVPAWAGRWEPLGFFRAAMAETPRSALYSNSREGPCLTIVDTEGCPPSFHCVWSLLNLLHAFAS